MSGEKTDAYEAPAVTVIGSLDELTHGVGISQGDTIEGTSVA